MMLLILISFIFFNFSYAVDNTKFVSSVLYKWNEANNQKDISKLSKLYSDNVIYYGKKLSKRESIKDKQRFFKKYPLFSQTIDNIKYTPIATKLYKVSFDKQVKLTPNRKSKIYPSYLIIDTSLNHPNIVEEGDILTDIKLNRAKGVKVFSFDGRHKVKGTIQKVKYYGPPGFGENPKVDKLLTAYILKLDEPIKVVKSNNSLNEFDSTTIATEIQLVAFDFLKQLDIAEQKHKKVELEGEFFSAHTGHHIRKLLMDVKSINF